MRKALNWGSADRHPTCVPEHTGHLKGKTRTYFTLRERFLQDEYKRRIASGRQLTVDRIVPCVGSLATALDQLLGKNGPCPCESSPLNRDNSVEGCPTQTASKSPIARRSQPGDKQALLNKRFESHKQLFLKQATVMTRRIFNVETLSSHSRDPASTGVASGATIPRLPSRLLRQC